MFSEFNIQRVVYYINDKYRQIHAKLKFTV